MSYPEPIRLIRLGLTEAWKTQAIYHALTENMTESVQDTIVLCQPAQPYLCLGYFQGLDDTFDREELQTMRLTVYRRRIGGGATYLDENQLFYQFIFHHTRVPVMPEKIYMTLLNAPLKTLQSFGLNARLRALNELEVDGKRIAGTGGGRLGEGCVVVGNFLFDFDYSTMSRVWAAPWAGYRELARQALEDRVYTFKKCAPHLTLSAVEERLMEQLSQSFNRPVVAGHLTDEETQWVERYLQPLQETGNAPVTSSHKKARPLKIAADIFVHDFLLEANGQKFHLSCLEYKTIITAVRSQHPAGDVLTKQMVDQSISHAQSLLESWRLDTKNSPLAAV